MKKNVILTLSTNLRSKKNVFEGFPGLLTPGKKSVYGKKSTIIFYFYLIILDPIDQGQPTVNAKEIF